jgi:hypothetical protein
VELNDLYSPPSIFSVITSRILRLSGHVADVGEGEVSVGFWFLKPKERDHIEDAGLDGRIILLRWTVRKLGVVAQTDWICLRIGKVGGRL